MQAHVRLTLGRTVEKERKKAEKIKKFEEKKAKAASTTNAPSKKQEKKAKQDNSKDGALPEYVEDTPVGEKKSKALRQGSVWQFTN